jgi:hypothetical protein
VEVNCQNSLYFGARIFVIAAETNHGLSLSIKLSIVFAQTKAKSLIQLYPEQQARMKEFAASSFSFCLYFYPFTNIGSQLLNCSVKTAKPFFVPSQFAPAENALFLV